MDTTGGLPRLLSPLELPPQINRWPGEQDDGKLTWIYGLSDPRDGVLHVIARSVNAPQPGAWIEPGTRAADATPYERWVMDMQGAHRFAATHLLACVPLEDGEEYKRIYAAVASELGCTLFGRYHRPDWWSRTNEDWAPVWAEAAWVLHRAYPCLPLREGATAPVYGADVLHRLGRPGLTQKEWLDRYHRLREQVEEEWLYGGPQMDQQPDESYGQYGARVGWDLLARGLLARGITPWQGSWQDGPPDDADEEPEPVARTERWPAGTRVVHPAFGPGRVRVSAPRGGDVEYGVVFDSGVYKTLMGSVARMVREE